jgi:hypothetical protein
LKETQLVVGGFPYKLLNGDVVVPLWAVKLRETNPRLFFVVCLACLDSSIFTLLPLDLLGCACL